MSSIILKTKNQGLFEAVQEELKLLEEMYNVRLPLVHGGIGPVIPADVVHAEIEKKYGHCPIYGFMVGIHPDAMVAAEKQIVPELYCMQVDFPPRLSRADDRFFFIMSPHCRFFGDKRLSPKKRTYLALASNLYCPLRSKEQQTPSFLL